MERKARHGGDRRPPGRSARRRRAFGFETLEPRLLLARGPLDLAGALPTPPLAAPPAAVLPFPLPHHPELAPADRPEDLPPVEFAPGPAGPVEWNLSVLVPASVGAPAAGAPVVRVDGDQDHDQFAEAPRVVVDRWTRLEGTLDGDEAADLFRVELPAGQGGLTLVLHAAGQTPLGPERLVVFDASGRLLTACPLPLRPELIALALRSGAMGPPRFVYVGLARSAIDPAAPAPGDAALPKAGESDLATTPAPGSAAPPPVLESPPIPSEADAAAAVSYAIEIFPGATAESGPGAPGVPTPAPDTTVIDAAPAPVSPVTVTIPAPGPPMTGVSAAIGLVNRAASLTTVAGPGRVPRPSPLRSAGPMGGLAGGRSTTRTVDAEQATAADLGTLATLRLDRAAGEPSGDHPEDGAAGDDTAGAVVPAAASLARLLLAPSGLPLLGSRLPGPGMARVLPSAVPVGPPRLARGASPGDPDAGAIPAALAPESGSTGSETDADPCLRPAEQIAVATGVGLAYVMAVTALMPDLDGAFRNARAGKRPRLSAVALRQLARAAGWARRIRHR